VSGQALPEEDEATLDDDVLAGPPLLDVPPLLETPAAPVPDTEALETEPVVTSLTCPPTPSGAVEPCAHAALAKTSAEVVGSRRVRMADTS